ncbi:MAG: rod shape-determining protein MreC, partial [Polaribacter sp.]
MFLECIAIALTLNNLNFHKSKFVNSANAITGSLYSKATNISNYFHLREENNQLLDENIRLRNQLQKLTLGQDAITEIEVIDSVLYSQKYTNISARIEKNNYTNEFNFLLINKGKKQEVLPEMAVINSKGIIGIVDNVSNNYGRVQSILNRNSKINARLKNSFYYGTLTWDGKDYNTVQLT